MGGKKYSSAEESTKIDYDTIKAVDLVCAIPGVPNSGGVHVELGWASVNKKNIKIFLNKNYKYSPMIEGLHCIIKTDYIYYENEYSDELISQLLKK